MIEALVFDKDGTLIQLGHAWDKPSIDVTDYLLSETSLSDLEKTVFRSKMGIQGEAILPNSIFAVASLGEQAQIFAQVVPRSADEIEDILMEFYLSHLQKNPAAMQLNPYVEEVLQEAQDQYRLALVTNDSLPLTRAILQGLGILDYFDFIGCADEFGPKPNPAALQAYSQRSEIPLDKMVYIGDSAVDMAYGKHTAAAIAYLDQEDHQSFLSEGDYFISDFRDLLPVIDSLNRKKEDK